LNNSNAEEPLQEEAQSQPQTDILKINRQRQRNQFGKDRDPWCRIGEANGCTVID
jgi:hypothetical protein